jgi:hypothetical protein
VARAVGCGSGQCLSSFDATVRAPLCTVVATVVLTFTHQFTHPSNKTRSICHHFMLVNKIIILELTRAHTGVSEKSTGAR